MESLFSKSNGPSAYDMIIAPTSDLGQKRASPAGAMRLLFGAVKIEVMPVNRTALRIMAGLRVRADSRAPTEGYQWEGRSVAHGSFDFIALLTSSAQPAESPRCALGLQPISSLRRVPAPSTAEHRASLGSR